MAASDTKKCPFCAEEIKREAIKCKHCGEWFEDHQLDQTSFEDRVLCADDNCIGILDSEGKCTDCGRTYEEVHRKVPRKKSSSFGVQQNIDTGLFVSMSGYTLNGAMVCPHCQGSNCVMTRSKSKKKGVSGSKLTGAYFTFGFSMLATGLSRKEKVTEAKCKRCGSVWSF